MTPGKEYRLTLDVHSICKPKDIYGKKGELVTVVSASDPVMIVKGDGGIFPVLIGEVYPVKIVE